MTPGQEALIEAMRVEQARIYGQVQREHRQDEGQQEAKTYRTLRLVHAQDDRPATKEGVA